MRLPLAVSAYSRKNRFEAVRALSAALFSVFALLAILHLIHSPRRTLHTKSRRVAFATEDHEDETLVRNAVSQFFGCVTRPAYGVLREAACCATRRLKLDTEQAPALEYIHLGWFKGKLLHEMQ